MAYVGKEREVQPVIYDGDEVKGVEKKVLIGPKHGAQNYVMRFFTLQEGGYTPKHSHPWEHEVYVVEGELELEASGEIHRLSQGSFAFVKADEEHQFRNAGSGSAKFICVIPTSGGE